MKTYDKYKSSGIDWIGDIPEHWDMKKISRSFETIGSGTTPTAGTEEYYANGTINWINTGDLNDGILTSCKKKITAEAFEKFSTLKIYPKNTLLIAMYGATIGKTAILDFEACTNQACCALADSKIYYSKYVFYWFLSSKTDIINLSYGGGQPNISQEIVRFLKLPFPPLDEQTAIAEYLDEKTAQIDKLIDEKRRLIELLKEERLGVINQAVTRGINRNAKLKPSGIAWLGDIPEHWEVKKLKFVLDCFNTIRIPLNADERGSEAKIHDYYGASGVIDKVGSYLFDGEYILIGEDGANLLDRNSPLAFKATGKFWVNNHAHILKPMSDDIDYFTYLLESIDYTIWISGSAQPKLTVERLLNVPLWFPQIEEQKQIVEFIETAAAKIDATIATIEKEIGFMREYRTALISEVVTGKIKVI